jgi:hypothetical protein
MTDPAPLKLARKFTDTPLKRSHEHSLQGGSQRKPKAIPFENFVRDDYPDVARGLAADLCRGLARGEYSAVALFSSLTFGLSRTGAPLDVLLAASRAGSDEARHAEYCLQMTEALTGEAPDIDVPESTFAVNAVSPDQDSVDYSMLTQVAVGETLAAALITECRRRATDPVLRAFFTTLASDELHHARLGWYYTTHRAGSWTLQQKQRLADRLAPHLASVERLFWVGRDAPEEAAPAARALGVLDSKTQREVIAQVMESEIVPGLDALGFSASEVWSLRPRGTPQ